MAINVSASQSISATVHRSQTVSTGADSEVRHTGAGVQAEQRATQNTLILEASLRVSISSGNDSQALLFRSAIEKINELLAPEKGVDAFQTALGEDNSPEGTAGRILAFATGFFENYAAQNPGGDQETLVRDFVDLIRGGFEQGYNEAADILQGLGVLEGDIATGVARTYELVQKGLDDFLASRLEALSSPSDEAAAADDAGAAAT